MRSEIGTRKRFIFRLISYFLLPLLGLFVIVLTPPNSNDVSPGGMWPGWIAIVVGLVAQYFLLSRLRSPVSAIRYALQPDRVLSELMNSELSKLSEKKNPHDVMDGVKSGLAANLPDVSLEEIAVDYGDYSAMVIGNESVVIVGNPPLTDVEINELIDSVNKLSVPLSNQKLYLIFTERLQESVKVKLQSQLQSNRIYEPH